MNGKTIKRIKDNRGTLSVIQDLPFRIRRIYWIVNGKGIRGNHAHYKLKQCFICIQGKCKVTLDNGRSTTKVILSQKRLIISPMIWHKMSEFTSDCILLVLTSEKYSRKDYITDYNKFKHLKQKQGGMIEDEYNKV